MKTPIYIVALGLGLTVLAQSAESRRIDALTLERAFAIAEEWHPTLSASRAEIDAARERASQAGRLPNPEAMARIESARLNGRTTGQAEYVGGVSQPIPLGGRLSAARDLQRADVARVEKQADVQRLALRQRIHNAFAAGLYLESITAIHSNALHSAEELMRIAKARVEAGDALKEELTQTEIQVIHARLELKAADDARTESLFALAAAIGDPQLTITALQGDVPEIFAITSVDSITRELDDALLTSALEANVAVERARVALARAERIPDINVDLFYRRLQTTKGDAFDAGLRIPLPLFTQPQAKVRETNARLAAAEAASQAARIDIAQQLRRSRADLSIALATARTIQSEMLPKAESVLGVAEARYSAGDTSLADVLAKRREWNAIQLRNLESLEEVLKAWRSLAIVVSSTVRN